MKSLKQRPIINTPIRTRELGGAVQMIKAPLTPSRIGKQNLISAAQYHSIQPAAGLSPNKIAATRKPISITKQLSQPIPVPPISIENQFRKTSSAKINMLSSRKKECANHPDKEAEFRIVIEGELMLYCKKCSTHLASQGFAVQKIQNIKGNSSRPSLPVASTSSMLEQCLTVKVDPSIASHPRYTQISSFISNIEEVSGCLRRNISSFNNLQNHYSEQCGLLQEFYDAMIEYMKHVKNQHLNLIKSESRKYVQIGEMEAAENEESIAELDYMSNDMQGNINMIVKEIAEENYRECLGCYVQKVEIHKHRVESQEATLQEVTTMNKDELETKLNEFRTTINDMFGIREATGANSHGQGVHPHQQSQIQAMQMMPMQQNKPSTSLQKKLSQVQQKPETSAPFRNLFEEEESLGIEQGLPDQSPQFKNI